MHSPSPSVLRLDPAVRDYFVSFGLLAIARYRDGHYAAVPDPVGAATAHWCKAEAARALVRILRRDGGDVPSVARRHGIDITGHDVAVARATQAVSESKTALIRLDAVVCWLRSTQSTNVAVSRPRPRASHFHHIRACCSGCASCSPAWRPVGGCRIWLQRCLIRRERDDETSLAARNGPGAAMQ